MACIITYENKQYTQKEFEQYFKEHFTEFIGEFINTPPDVILPIGTSGSGKSTFIKSLPQENLVVIEPDAMRVEFTGNMNDKSKDKEIYIEASNRAIQAIKQGKQIVFDTTNLTKDKRLSFIEAIKKAIPTANIQYKLMELNPELAKQRIKAQLSRGENRAAVSDETIDRHAASYKQMLEDIKSEPITKYKELSSKQDIEGFKKFTNSNTMPQLSSLESPKADPITMSKIKSLLKQIGFTEDMVQIVDQITVDGKKVDANGVAIIADKIIQIAQGKENIALPEEAMHFVVELLKINKPSLYNELLKDVTSYQIYKDLINNEDYQNAYRKSNGSLDIQKMKDEAIAKVLVSFITEGNLPRVKEEQKVENLFTLWSKILQYLKQLFFNKANPFEKIIQKVLNEDTSDFGTVKDLDKNPLLKGAYFSLPISEKTEKIHTSVKNRVLEFNISKVDSEYIKNGKEHKSRVTNIVDKYYIKKFGAKKTWTAEKQKLYDEAREDGNKIHSVIEAIINMYINPKTGLIRETPLEVPDFINNSKLNFYLYTKLEDQIITLLNKFEDGSRFAVEQIVYNPETDMMGTIDLLIIDTKGKVSVFDWKSIMYEEFSKFYGLKDFKREAFDIQMLEYQKILKSYPEITEFEYMRMIPISKIYKENKKGELKLAEIRAVINPETEKGDVPEYLKPFISKAELSVDPALDKFIDSLTKQIDEIKIRYKATDSDKMQNLVTLLHKVIYDLKVAGDYNLELENINIYIATQISEAKKALSDIETIDNLNIENLNKSLREIRFLRESLSYLKESNIFFQLVQTDVLDTEEEGLLNLQTQLFETEQIIHNLENKEKTLLNNLALENNIINLLQPEESLGMFEKIMRSSSQSKTAAGKLFYKLVDVAYQKASFDLDEQYRVLDELKWELENEAKSNNMSLEKYLDILFKKDKNGKFNGHFISELDSEFFKQRDEISRNDDVNKRKAWFNKNYKIDKYQEWFVKDRKKFVQSVKESVHHINPKINNKIKDQHIANYDARYNILKNPETALSQNNKFFWNNFINVSEWPSKEFADLEKKPALLKAFNHFRSVNNELRETGLLGDQNSYTFIPNVRKSLAESLTLSNKDLKRLLPFHNFLNDIKTSDESIYLGNVDPRNGEKINELNMRFVNDNFKNDYSEKSKDLFSSYYLMSNELAKYKHLKQIEDLAKSLLHLEKSKKSINKKGQEINNNITNTDFLEQQIKALVYSETLQTQDMTVSYDYNKFVERWNNSLLGKIKKLEPLEEGEVTISANKFMMKLNNMNSVRVLSGNITSALANLFGGTASTYLLGDKYFNSKDLSTSLMHMQSSAWYATDEMKKRAALVDFFMPLLDQKENLKSSQLSIAKASEILSGEWLMAAQRKGDDFVQLNIFLSMIDNFTIINGKLISIKQMIQEKNGFDKIYDLPTKKERDALFDKIEKEIEEYRKDNSLVAKSVIKKRMFKGKEESYIEIPGLERNSEEMFNFRRKTQAIVKDAIGNMSPTDVANYKNNIYFRLFMSFKNWIPRTADVRFGEFRYDSGHDAWEYGRYRMMWSSLSSNYLTSLAKLIPFIGKGVSKFEGQELLINAAKKEYLKKIEYLKSKGLYNSKNFPKEAEFIKSYIEGVNATFTEMRIASILIFLLMSTIMAPDDDDDDETKNGKRKFIRLIDKMADELSFFYNFNSFLDIMGSKPLPVFSFISDSQKLITSFGQEFAGLIFQNDEWVESAKPAKMFFKMFPISKEIIGYIPIIDPELGKEMGIEITQKNKN